MPITPLLALAAMSTQSLKPTLWLSPSGGIYLNGNQMKANITPGVSTVRFPAGVAYDFSGERGGILLGDLDALKPKGSFTISTWLFLRSYVNDGPGAQVFFRGDDRNGYDSYSMVVTGDKVLSFCIWNSDSDGMSVRAEMPLGQWVHIVASFDAASGRMDLWKNGFQTSFTYTTRIPEMGLEDSASPGIGIGNVQNNQGPHNQPLNGLLADVKFYNGVLTPLEIGYEPGTWNETPLARSSAQIK